jgi:hypothetical protein
MSLPAWNSEFSANKYIKTYFSGYVDVSGGDIINRTGNLNLVTGGIKAGAITVTNSALGYCANFISDAQTQITNLASSVGGLVTATQNISYSGGATNIAGTLTYSGTLNGVSPSTFAFISSLSSSAQNQFNTLTSNLSSTNTTVSGHTSSINSLNTTVASHTSNLTNITYNSSSTYTDMYNVYIGSNLISEGTTLKNTTLITGSISANSLTISAIQLGYLANLSADVQTAITNLNTKTAGVVAGGGGYTNIDFLDVTDYFYSATGSQLDGTTLITGPLSMSSTSSISANSLSITPSALSYLANVTSDIQAQFNSTSGVTSGAQTWSGIKTFSSPPVMSGASISSSTIPDTALVSTFVKTSGTTTIAGIKTFSSPPVMSGASITASTIPDTALALSYLQLSGAQNCAGVKTFSGNCVFSGNPNFSGTPTFGSAVITDANLASVFVKTTTAQTIAGIKTFSSPPVMSGASITSATIPISALASSTFTSNINAPSILLDNTGYTSFYTMNSGTSTVNSMTIKARSSTATYNNPTSVSGDVEISSFNNTTPGAGGLNLCMGSTISGGVRITESNINFNSPITVTGNITSNSQTVTPANLGYLSGASANIQSAITSNTTTISSHTTSISALQTATTNIGYSSPVTTIYGTTNIGTTSITGLLTLPTSIPTLPNMLQLGGSTSASPSANTAISSSTNTNITSITISNVGTFLLNYNITFNRSSGTTTGYCRGGINTTSATFLSNNNSYSGLVTIDTNGISIHGSQVVTNTSSSVTYYLVGYQTATLAVNYTTNSYLQVVRIA